MSSGTELIEHAFTEFSRVSDTLVTYYTVLETTIRDLKKEIEKKNAELEKSKVYLQSILDSLPICVSVFDDESVVFSNKQMEALKKSDLFMHIPPGKEKSGEFGIGRSRYRWRREKLRNGLEGKVVMVFEDVTEIERMKERNEMDKRLMAMGEMAARIAHEIKNPLGSMELFLSLLMNEKKKRKEYLDYILLGIKTIDRIINNILSYTRPRQLLLKKAYLYEVIKEMIDFMSITFKGKDIKIELDSSYKDASLFDPDLMRLVIMNLMSNAVDAVNKQGTIKIKLTEERECILLSISDDGIGMDEEVHKNIFNPFFTTKEKGVGLGLFIVYNIIKAHNGYIEVESSPDRGSIFNIYIPKGML